MGANVVTVALVVDVVFRGDKLSVERAKAPTF
jgi:hypothetical protein